MERKRVWIIILLSMALAIGLRACASADDANVVLFAAHTEGELNIRESPYGDRIGYLLPGDSGEFISQNGEWVLMRIGIEAGQGWVNAQYLTVDPTAAGRYINSSGGRVKFRETPGGKAVGWLKSKHEVMVLSVLPDENGDLWGRTKNGYIMMQCLERVSENGG